MEPYLKMRNISKTFPGVKALENVNLDVYEGEIVALVGENGAGKSTLMKILTGVYSPDIQKDSRITLGGTDVVIQDTIHARELGISIIYQELATIQNLTVAENIFLGEEPRNLLGLIDSNKMNEDAKKVMQALNMEINPSTLVGDLSVGQQQMIEITKAISHEAKILVMDEPTASLSHSETKTLMDLIRSLRRQNIGIIYISHKLEEVFELADRISVLRDGKPVGELTIGDATQEKLVKMMVDRDLSDMYHKTDSYDTPEVVLEARFLSDRKNKKNMQFIKNVNFKLHKGEILGFAGLVGSGRSEIMELIFGMRPYEGEILMDGMPVEINSPSDAIDYGIGFIPEDRKKMGLVLDMSVRENFTLTELERYCSGGFINSKMEEEECNRFIDVLKIKTPSIEQRVLNLSGGNQQKVVIAKWISRKPKVLILDEPTRGIDVGAKAEVHALMTQLSQQGIGIIMVSSELPEVLAMSDHVIVIKEGCVCGEFNREEAGSEKIMEACSISSKNG